MDRQGFHETRFFIGTELESSLAKGLKTLFVISEQPLDEIIELITEHDIKHVYLCANKSYSDHLIEYYLTVVKYLTDKSIYVTVDYPITSYSIAFYAFKKYHASQYFIPMINVEMPHFSQIPNVAVRIDDIDFNKTNPGVWVLNHKTIGNSEFFTPWSDYDSDHIIK